MNILINNIIIILYYCILLILFIAISWFSYIACILCNKSWHAPYWPPKQREFGRYGSYHPPPACSLYSLTTTLWLHASLQHSRAHYLCSLIQYKTSYLKSVRVTRPVWSSVLILAIAVWLTAQLKIVSYIIASYTKVSF